MSLTFLSCLINYIYSLSPLNLYIFLLLFYAMILGWYFMRLIIAWYFHSLWLTLRRCSWLCNSIILLVLLRNTFNIRWVFRKFYLELLIWASCLPIRKDYILCFLGIKFCAISLLLDDSISELFIIQIVSLWTLSIKIIFFGLICP